MNFPFGQTIFRDRRATVTSDYSPRQVRGDWDPALTISISGFVASSSGTGGVPRSIAIQTADRVQIQTNKSAYFSDPNADVQTGDRLRVGGTLEDMNSGTPYYVDVRTDADVNPFTGWQPVLEVPLVLVEG